MSFRKYGGTNKLEKNNNITVHSIVADTFTIRDAFLSIFTIEGDLRIGGNGFITNTLTVNQQINATTLDISSNATIEGILYLDKAKDVFLSGNNKMIGLNKSTPTATLDISSNQVQAFNLKTSAANNRNIIARNLTNNGIAVVATGTTESGIQFYSANTGTIDVSNAQGAMIKYSNTDSLLSLDSTGGDVKVLSKMIITDNTSNGNTHTSFGETVLIYDKDNGVNQPVFFNDVYGNTTVKTGSAITVQSINNASNTFVNIATPSKLGIQVGGGSYPKDPSRSMGIIDVYNPSITNEFNTDNDATPSIMLVSGNSVTKFNSTTGFNTFQPKYNNYAVDINGPLHLNNGEVKKIKEPTTRIRELYNFGASYGIAVGGIGTEENNSYYTYVTFDGGKSWTRQNPLTSTDINSEITGIQTFNSIYSYSATRTIIGGTGAYIWVTDNGGVNWYQLFTIGINTINAIYSPPGVSENFVYIGGDAGGGNAIIQYGYIESFTHIYTGLPGNPTATRYRYNTDLSYNYPIVGGIVSDFTGYGQNFLVVGGNKIIKFDLGPSKTELTLVSTYTNPGSVTYSAIRMADANNAVAVGANVISYTKNGGTTWTTANISPSLSGKTFNNVFLDGTMNAIVVGNNGYIYSSNDGYYTWKIVDEDVLNASGVGSRITDPTNDITSVFMPDSSTIILSIVKNNDSNARASKFYYLNMPNIFNNKQNFLFDVSGCIRMSGDLILSQGGEIKSTDSTFNLLTTNVATLNAATNALNINMGGTNTTNISIGGANTVNLLAGGNGTTSKIGPLNISSLTTGNVTLANNLVTGNVFPNNIVISNNLQVTNGIATIANTINSVSATSGALQIYGGVGIQKDLHTSGSINTSGNLFVSGNNIQMVSSDDVLFDNVTINTYNYVPDTGPVRIKGGAAISKNMYVGNDLRVEGNIILKGTVTSFSGLSQTTTIDAVLILTPFHGNSTQDVDYLSLAQGALTTDGGFGVGKNTWLRGNLRVDGVDGVNINAQLESISTNSGSLRIVGGVGIGGNVYTGGNVIVNSTIEAINTATGALQIRGGVGIGGNVYTGGNVIVNSTIEAINTATGALQIRGGVAIVGNTYHGGNVIVNSTIEAINTATGALQIRGGVGIGGNVYTGGNIIVNSTIEAINTATGAIQIRGGAAIVGNTYHGGNVIVNSTIEAINTATGALQIVGGVGIGGNVYAGGNIIVNSTIEAINTVTGALQIRGGVAIGRNLYTGGNVIINSTIESTSISSGALQIVGGVGIGGNVYAGGNIIVNSTIEAINTVTGALQIRGGVAIGRNLYTGGNVIINSSIESTSISTGALQIIGGVGIGGNVYTGGNVIVNSSIETTNTVTGALQIRGGVAIGRNLYTGGNVIINSTTESTTTATGALQVLGGVGIGGNVNIGGNVFINKTTIVLDTTDASSFATGAFQVKGGIGVEKRIVSASLTTGSIGATNLALSSTITTLNTGSGALTVAGGIGVGGDIRSRAIYVDELNARVQIIASSEAESNTTLNGAAVISGGMGVAKNLNVGGDTRLSNTSVVGSLNVNGGTTLSGLLNVTGNSRLSNTSIVGSLNVNGGTTLSGLLNVTGASTLSNTTIVGSMVVTGGSLTVSGKIVNTGLDSSYNNIIALIAANQTTNLGTLNVSGITTLNNTTITGSLNIYGGSLEVSGLWVAVGDGAIAGGNSIAISRDGGTTWSGLGTPRGILAAYAVAWNGNLWVALGQGGNTIVTSPDGINWTGRANTNLFSTLGNGVAWSPSLSLWVAVGQGTAHTIATSSNGIEWTGIGTTIFNSFAYGVAWNGSYWVAVGGGGNSIATSPNGTAWTGRNNNPFSGAYGVAWNGSYWVAVGAAGTHTIATSTNGIDWNGVTGTTIFSNVATGVAWNGSLWVVVGNGTGGNTIAISSDGNAWTGLGKTIFSNWGWGVSWNGSLFVATGDGGNAIATSPDGINWTGRANIFGIKGYGSYGTPNNTRLSGPLTVTQDTFLRSSLNVTGPTSLTYTTLTNTTIRTSMDQVLVAVGSGGNKIAISINGGSTWTGQISPFSNQGQGVAWNGSLWVAVGGYYGITIATSPNGTEWTGVTSGSPFSVIGYGVAWSPSLSLWVAVGQGGGNTIATSTNGTSWTGLGTTIFSTGGYGVAWNGSLWVAVGQGGNTIATSPNGTAWTGVTVNPPFSTAGYGVAWSGSLWVAVGQGGNTIATSPNGTAWTGLGITIFSTVGYGVAWSPLLSLWVAVGRGTNTIATSPNGTSWTGLGTTIFSTAGDGITWSGSAFVAVGQGGNTIATSPNGTTWSGVTVNSPFNIIGYGVAIGGGLGSLAVTLPSSISSTTITGSLNIYQEPREASGGLLVAVGQGTNNTMATSSDGGITWIGLGITTFSFYGSGVSWNGSLWVAVGGLAGNSIATSTNGTSWSGLGRTIFSTGGNGVAWNGSLWVAVGEGGNTIATSPNGTTWTGVTVNSPFNTAGHGVAWSPSLSLWVAVGSGGNTIATSPNGTAWTGVTVNRPFNSSGRGVAWNGSLLVAVGEGGGNTIAYSTNGTEWTGVTVNRPFNTTGWGVAWNSSLWVAVGSGGNTIAYSTNGIAWTGLDTTVFSNAGRGVTWSGSSWVATGSGGNTIATSTDGINWTGRATSLFNTSGLGVAGFYYNIPSEGALTVNGSSILSDTTINGSLNVYQGSLRVSGLWVAVGETTNTIGTSSDGGITWTGRTSPFSTRGYGVAWNGSLWVAVGQGGNSIATSTNGINWTGRTGTNIFNTAGWGIAWSQSLSLWVAVGQGSTHTIATSTNGIDWTGLGRTIFSASGYVVAWNGTLWVAVGGGGGNTIAISSNGIDWIGQGTTIFSSSGYGVAWSPSLSLWVAVGQGGNTIATSPNGTTWTGRATTSLFSNFGFGVAWSPSLSLWVAVGTGTGNTIATSSNGTSWTGLGTTTFGTAGYGVAWNGSMFVAVGTTGNTIATSTNGIDWTGRTSPFSTAGRGVAGTPDDTTMTGTVTSNGTVLINSNVPSVSATTGSLQIRGGLGVTGNIFAGGMSLNSAITSTSTSSGSLRIVGGLGVTGNIFAGAMVTAPFFNTSSDRRIKKDITDLNFPSLEIMRKIRPREYTMIDGNKESVYGFIAQEVIEIIPKSINIRKGYIPSIYENAFVEGNNITLLNKSTTDISCCKLKLRDQNNEDIFVSVTSIHDNKTFSINTDIKQSTSCMDICGTILDKYIENGVTTYMRGSQIYAGEVRQGIFVYGSQVDDFHSINKDTIWTITLSATQEMDLQLQEARRTIRTLEERIAAIEKRLS